MSSFINPDEPIQFEVTCAGFGLVWPDAKDAPSIAAALSLPPRIPLPAPDGVHLCMRITQYGGVRYCGRMSHAQAHAYMEKEQARLKRPAWFQFTPDQEGECRPDWKREGKWFTIRKE